MTFSERKVILENLNVLMRLYVLKMMILAVHKRLRKIKMHIQKKKSDNGGDRNKLNIPEMSIDGVEFIFGLEGK